MKICMLSELFYPYMLGGAERRYFEIAKRLAKKHDVTVYSLRLFGQKEKDSKDGVVIRRVGAKHPLNRRSILPLPTFFPAVLKQLAGDFDIVDANQGIASFTCYTKYLSLRPLVATFHDIYWNQWGKYFPFPFSSAGKFMELLLSKGKFSSIIANSPETKRKLELLGFASRIHVVVSGIDASFINRIKGGREETAVTYAGRLVKYKNVDTLIRAASLLQKDFPGLKLNIIGSGPEEQNLRNLARKMDVNAAFHGFVSEEEKFRIIKSSAIFVNPSSVEGLGLALLEAMACKTAVVAKNLDCYFFCNSRNSVLYKHDSGLYKALRLLLVDDERRQRIAKNSWQTSLEYTWDKTARKVEDIYTAVLNESR